MKLELGSTAVSVSVAVSCMDGSAALGCVSTALPTTSQAVASVAAAQSQVSDDDCTMRKFAKLSAPVPPVPDTESLGLSQVSVPVR